MIRLNRAVRRDSTSQRSLRLPLNPRPAKYVAPDFGFGFKLALFPGPKTEPPKYPTATRWNFVLHKIQRVVLRNCWFHHNPKPPL